MKWIHSSEVKLPQTVKVKNYRLILKKHIKKKLGKDPWLEWVLNVRVTVGNFESWPKMSDEFKEMFYQSS